MKKVYSSYHSRARAALRTCFLLLLFLSTHFIANAQNHRINGQIKEAEGEPLSSATITLLSQTDSVLLAFAIANNSGNFEIKGIKSGDYIIQATFLGYAPYSAPISISSDLVHHIELESASAMLDQVTVKAELIPILINGDTVQYNAAAFKTKPNAAVEDLLKKLPGVEVRQDGSIRAQGEEVQNVLVNGKEFFGDDTRIATQNLPADIVDKVEVYDKKSDMAEFSGIDDGQDEKTINLALKEGVNGGSFGKLSAGYGTEDRYTAKGNFNRFNNKMQFSALGMLNNTNEQGFSLDEYMSLMGGMNSLMSEGGGFELSLNADDMALPLNLGQGNPGLQKTTAIGTNLNYEFSKKTELNANYFYSHLNNTKDRSISRQNFTELGVYNYHENGVAAAISDNHKFSAKLTHKIDSLSDIITKVNIGFSDRIRRQQKQSQTANFSDMLENTTQQNYNNNGDNWRTGAAMTYRRKFRKAGRFLSLKATADNNTVNNDALLDAVNQFFNNNTIDTLEQKQIGKNDELNYQARISYTEPLGKGNYIEANYTHQNFSNDLLKDFYDRPSSENLFNTELSSLYEQDYIYDQVGLSYKRNKKKSTFALSLKAQQAKLKGKIRGLNEQINNDFFNLLPSLRWRHEFTTSKNIGLRYNTNMRQPTLRELQPIVDNSDPLNQYIGNPDLQPAYIHNVNLSFMSFDQFSFVNFYASVNARYTENPIIQAQGIDSLFRQQSRSINAKDASSVGAYFLFDTPIRAIKSKINLSWEPRLSNAYVYVNGQENKNQLLSNTLGFSIENRKKEWIDLALGCQLTFDDSRYDNESLNQSYNRQKYYADLSINTKNNWSFSSSLDVDIYSSEAFGEQQVLPLWQASVSKLIWNNKLELKLSAFDILNENKGIERLTQSNFTQEVNTLTISQYFMLSATYSLSGFANDGGISFEASGR